MALQKRAEATYSNVNLMSELCCLKLWTFHVFLTQQMQNKRVWEKPFQIYNSSFIHIHPLGSPQRASNSSSPLARWGSFLGPLPTPWQLWTAQWEELVAWSWSSSSRTFSLFCQACLLDPGWSRVTLLQNSVASWSTTWSCMAASDHPADRLLFQYLGMWNCTQLNTDL